MNSSTCKTQNCSGKFLGVQRFSYNQFLEFELNVEDLGFADDPGSGFDALSDPVAYPSREDVVLEGAGFKVTASINSQVNNSFKVYYFDCKFQTMSYLCLREHTCVTWNIVSAECL